MPQTLQLILLLLAAAVVVVVACRLLRLPPILGYLVVGIAVGPHALAWVPDNADVRDLAEFGIVFLMFSIGLEFSLPQLNSRPMENMRNTMPNSARSRTSALSGTQASACGPTAMPTTR